MNAKINPVEFPVYAGGSLSAARHIWRKTGVAFCYDIPAWISNAEFSNSPVSVACRFQVGVDDVEHVSRHQQNVADASTA